MGQDARGSGLNAGDGRQHGGHFVDPDLRAVEEQIPSVPAHLVAQDRRHEGHEVRFGYDEVESESVGPLKPEAAVGVGRAPHSFDQHFDGGNDIGIVETEKEVVADTNVVVVIETFADQCLDNVSAACGRIQLSERFAQHDLHMIFEAGQKGQPGRLRLAQIFGQFFVDCGQKLEDARRAVAGHAGKR